jgi:hypothetical protein
MEIGWVSGEGCKDCTWSLRFFGHVTLRQLTCLCFKVQKQESNYTACISSIVRLINKGSFSRECRLLIDTNKSRSTDASVSDEGLGWDRTGDLPQPPISLLCII